MKRFLAALLLLPALAMGAGNDLLINQRNPADTATLTRAVVPPSGGGVNGVMGYSGATNLPVFFRFGAGLELAAGAVVALPQTWADITGKPSFATVATTGAYADLTGRPTIPAAQQQSDWLAVAGVTAIANKPSLAPVATSGAYADLSGKPALFSGAYADLTGVPSTFTPTAHTHAAGDIVSGTLATARLPALAISQTTGLQASLDSKFPAPTGSAAQYLRGDGSVATFPTIPGGTVTSVTAGTGLSGGTITTTGTISLPNTGTAGTYANITTDAQGRVTAGTNRSQSSVTRPLNTAFQPNTTRDVDARYSVQCQVTASITGGQNCDVFIDIATDQAFTQSVQQVGVVGQGQVYTLAVAIQGVQPQTQQVIGYIPAGYWARIRTVQNLGAPTFTYRLGQEILQ